MKPSRAASSDPEACLAALKRGGLHVRTEMATGRGGRQIQIEDPDGYPIDLFEPARGRERRETAGAATMASGAQMMPKAFTCTAS
jgi:hypothetical protein